MIIWKENGKRGKEKLLLGCKINEKINKKILENTAHWMQTNEGNTSCLRLILKKIFYDHISKLII